MNEIVESRTKYGVPWEENLDELARVLNGDGLPVRSGGSRVDAPAGEEGIDESFMRQAGDSDTHYGR